MSPTATTAPPTALPVDPGNIPVDLRERPQCVAWQWSWVDDKDGGGKWTKVPVDARTGGKASTTDPRTWTTFDAALAFANRHRLPGVGYVFAADDPYAGVDLDGCRDPESGVLASGAAAIVGSLASYAEASPSGRGVHVVVRGKIPGDRRRHGAVEMYDAGRYFTLTGHRLPGCPATVEARQDALAALYAATFAANGHGPPEPSAATGTDSPSLSDAEVIEKARNAKNGAAFDRLFLAGDTSGHGGDDSAADLALLSLLAFWTQDAAQLDRLFRRSGLYRAKWERADYRERTIAKALDRAEVWRPGPTVNVGGHRGADDETGADTETGGTAPRRETVASWPALDPAALYGLPGAVAAAVGPETEGDPVAILVNFLMMTGNAIGGGPFVAVGGARHGVADFAAQVGDTAKSRKGSAYADTYQIVREADPTWAGTRVTGGLSSGEGLIYPIRDPMEATKKGEVVVTDPGEPDKRLLCLEEEFSAVLKVATREGNTITEQLRKAWDGRQLGAMTRNSPLRASDPHVSILAHITNDELRRVFDSTDAANGFGNRFAWFAVRRSKFLPEGGRVPDAELAGLVARTRDALDFARRQGEVRRDAAARDLWADVYPVLSAAKPGLLGALTARSEAHVLRWSLLYALLDHAAAIGTPHLLAALALWDYAEASVRRVFGDATGDPIADRILAALRANGPMAQAEVVDLFGRNVAAARLGRAQEELVRAGLIRSEQEATGGRPRTVWRAV